jgi:hypothetical protein
MIVETPIGSPHTSNLLRVGRGSVATRRFPLGPTDAYCDFSKYMDTCF